MFTRGPYECRKRNSGIQIQNSDFLGDLGRNFRLWLSNIIFNRVDSGANP